MRILYRNADDQWVAGVCGGIAKQFDVDPSIIRVLMALFCLSGAWGIILYAILWIILPKKPLGHYTGKRFFRDMNNKIIAGVCSGIAHYFAWDVRIVRLVFLAPLILALVFGIFSWPLFFQGIWYWNFIFQGSVIGSFVFAYILLWLILPPSHEIENQDYSHVPESVGKALGAIIRVFFLFLLGVLIFCFFVFLMASLFAGAFLWPLNGFIWTSDWQQYLALSVLVFFVGTPVLGFIIWLIRRATGMRFGSLFLRWSLALLWLVGIASLILLITSIVSDLRYYERSDPIAISITQPPRDLMLVQVSGPALTTDRAWFLGGNLGWDVSKANLKLPFVDIRVMKSQDASFHVTIVKFSAGRTRDDAKRRADEVEYHALYKNGVLDLENGFSVHRESKYRLQNVFVEIAIPVGKKIRFDESAKQKLNRIEVHVKSGERWSRQEVEIVSEAFPWKTNVNYTMTADGNLKEANSN